MLFIRDLERSVNTKCGPRFLEIQTNWTAINRIFRYYILKKIQKNPINIQQTTSFVIINYTIIIITADDNFHQLNSRLEDKYYFIVPKAIQFSVKIICLTNNNLIKALLVKPFSMPPEKYKMSINHCTGTFDIVCSVIFYYFWFAKT